MGALAAVRRAPPARRVRSPVADATATDACLLARLHDGDWVKVDAVAGTLDVLTPGVLDRPNVRPDLVANGFGTGRELFAVFRDHVGAAEAGATPFF